MNKKERLKQALEFHSVPFDENDVYSRGTRSRLSGHRDKDFYSMSSDKFELFLSIVTFEESSFITRDDESLKDGYIPPRLSVVKKTINSNNYKSCISVERLLYSEVLGSQLMEFFSCPTSYNVAVEYDEKVEQDFYEVLSVDFIKEGQKFFTFKDFACVFEGCLEDNVRQIRYEMNLDYFSKFSEEQKKGVIDDYVYSFFIRRYLLKDRDFTHGNSGLLVDVENGRLQYINFDFEYTFGTRRSSLKENLEYCYREFPHILDKLFERVSECRTLIKDIATDGDIELKNYFHREYVEDFCYNLEDMYWTIKKMDYSKKVIR